MELLVVFLALMGLAFLYAATVTQRPDTFDEIMAQLDGEFLDLLADVGEQFVGVMRSFGLSMGEAAVAMGGFARAIDPGITVPLFTEDESHGMTLQELIPEAIDEWTQVRGVRVNVTKRHETKTG